MSCCVRVCKLFCPSRVKMWLTDLHILWLRTVCIILIITKHYRRNHFISKNARWVTLFNWLKVHIAVCILWRKHPPLQVDLYFDRPALYCALLFQEFLKIYMHLPAPLLTHGPLSQPKSVLIANLLFFEHSPPASLSLIFIHILSLLSHVTLFDDMLKLRVWLLCELLENRGS